MIPMILKLDARGRAVKWVTWQEAAVLYVRELVAWTAGEHTLTLRGGTNRLTGFTSELILNSIIAIKGQAFHHHPSEAPPPLTNRALFYRDQNLCLYCGHNFPSALLTRDHILPLSQGGDDTWMNVVAACQACNTRKGADTPEEARMPLLAIPFVPNHAEYLALSNRRILADQMKFLQKQFRHQSRLLRC